MAEPSVVISGDLARRLLVAVEDRRALACQRVLSSADGQHWQHERVLRDAQRMVSELQAACDAVGLADAGSPPGAAGRRVAADLSP